MTQVLRVTGDRTIGDVRTVSVVLADRAPRRRAPDVILWSGEVTVPLTADSALIRRLAHEAADGRHS